ncbi:YbbR-like domain-containing protein [Anaerosphaera multitolerans]|uniref:YbbR-like domain-containing protein n=1 Tax=Anaerosphaera multitolerans TaxID=2487351 RepID=A0A437S7A6_9FIRM|nr:CdaR family protein [Anaerosphaera multitolerans]RVU54939.1 hypothetical protein EF514_04965 [Anaerosphaera multitolerans]
MKKIKVKNSRDTMLKLISIVFAILLWSYVRGADDIERTVVYKDIDIKFENLSNLKDRNLSLISSENPTVDVTIRGKHSNISNLKRENVRASVDLADLPIGEQKAPIKVQVDSTNVFIDLKNPEYISLKVDENVSKELQVDLKIKGKPSNNYVLGNIKQNEYVTVSGAKTYVDSIDSIVAIADVSNKKESSVMSIPIVAYDKEENIVENITIEPENVDFEIPILKTEVVPVKLNVIGEIPEGVDSREFSVFPDYVSIKGNTAVINKIDEITTVPVTVDELMSGQIPIDIDLPNGVSLVDSDIKFVASGTQIILNEQNIKINSDNIKILNLDDKLDVQGLDRVEEINITIVPKDPISEEIVNVEDVTASLDFANLKAGEQQLKVNVNLPEKFKVIKIDPEMVKVNVVKKRLF